MRTHFGDFSADAFETLFDKRFQRLAFGFTRHDEIVKRAVERGENVGGDSIKVLLLSGHHARPAQNIDWIDFAFVALQFYPVSGGNQLLRQFFVKDKLALRAGIRLKTQATLDFTACQTGTDALAHHGFKAAELLRQTEIGFQVALVY